MRRLVANSMLLVMLGILFAPTLLTAAPQPNSACCRPGGAHQCMRMTEIILSTNQAALRRNDPCPMRQGAQLTSSIVALPVSGFAALDLHRQALFSSSALRTFSAELRCSRSRGPPIVVLS